VKISSPALSCSDTGSAPRLSTQHGTLPSRSWNCTYQRRKSRTSGVNPISRSAAEVIAPSRIHERE
jgi:hypothetical protein